MSEHDHHVYRALERIERAQAHQHVLLHEILEAVEKDPAKLAAITARLEASRKALTAATTAAQP